MTAHLPADDAIFALALAAWWQLRRSAYLLPHLRKGPASIGVRSGGGVLSWVRAVTAISTSITSRRMVPTDSRDDRPTTDVLDTVPMAVLPPPLPAAAWDAWTTTPDLAPVGRRQPLPPPAPVPRHPSASIPHPRPAMDPPTYPSLAVGQAPTPTANRREPITRTPTPPRGSV